MKTMKRIAATSAAAIMAISMIAATSSFAAFAESTTTITVSTEDPHSYKYYQILTGTFSDELLLDEGLAFGSGVNADALKTALGLEDTATAADVLDKLDGMSSTAMTDLLKTSGVLKGDGTALNPGSNEVAQGYYYIVESDGTTTGDILKIADTAITVTPKFGTPAVEKKILEDDRAATTGSDISGVTYDDKWNDAADYSIGESVPFKITGTLPANLADYSHYYYKLTDNLGDGFVTPADSAITVKIDGNTVGTGVTVNCDSATNTITITFADILAVYDEAGDPITVTANSKVTVDYSATLDTDAVIGNLGNTNGVYLTYTNNTSYDGNGTPGEGETDDTPEDGVVAFTYTLNTIKVDGKDNTVKLSNAKFKLLNADGTKAAIITDGKFAGWAADVDGGIEITTSLDGKFEVIGLDSGTYKIRETAAPTGYNKLADDITVVVTASMNNNGTWDYVEDNGSTAFTSISVKYDEEDGTADAATGVLTGNVENNKGAELPETGGIGTKLFYIGGGALVLASGVLLVTKRRMKKDAE